MSLDHLVRAPGVFQTDEQIAEEGDFWPAVEKALKKALDAMVKMREREGAHLKQDLLARIAAMRKASAKVQQHVPTVTERYREQLIERIRSAGLEAPVPDDERLLKEVVYFADRSDITEELTRLQSHFQQFDDCVKSGASRTDAGFSRKNESRGQHHRLQSQRQPDLARSGPLRGNWKIQGTSANVE